MRLFIEYAQHFFAKRPNRRAWRSRHSLEGRLNDKNIPVNMIGLPEARGGHRA